MISTNLANICKLYQKASMKGKRILSSEMSNTIYASLQKDFSFVIEERDVTRATDLQRIRLNLAILQAHENNNCICGDIYSTEV